MLLCVQIGKVVPPIFGGFVAKMKGEEHNLTAP